MQNVRINKKPPDNVIANTTTLKTSIFNVNHDVSYRSAITAYSLNQQNANNDNINVPALR